jgi:hypothetical protein
MLLQTVALSTVLHLLATMLVASVIAAASHGIGISQGLCTNHCTCCAMTLSQYRILHSLVCVCHAFSRNTMSVCHAKDVVLSQLLCI